MSSFEKKQRELKGRRRRKAVQIALLILPSVYLTTNCQCARNLREFLHIAKHCIQLRRNETVRRKTDFSGGRTAVQISDLRDKRLKSSFPRRMLHSDQRVLFNLADALFCQITDFANLTQ